MMMTAGELSVFISRRASLPHLTRSDVTIAQADFTRKPQEFFVFGLGIPIECYACGSTTPMTRSKEGSDMLVLSRKLGEKIYIGDNICITVVDIDRGKIRLGIEAPREVPIYRQELLPLKNTDSSIPGSNATQG
jgi:carbon storage regulator